MQTTRVPISRSHRFGMNCRLEQYKYRQIIQHNYDVLLVHINRTHITLVNVNYLVQVLGLRSVLKWLSNRSLCSFFQPMETCFQERSNIYIAILAPKVSINVCYCRLHFTNLHPLQYTLQQLPAYESSCGPLEYKSCPWYCSSTSELTSILPQDAFQAESLQPFPSSVGQMFIKCKLNGCVRNFRCFQFLGVYILLISILRLRYHIRRQVFFH